MARVRCTTARNFARDFASLLRCPRGALAIFLIRLSSFFTAGPALAPFPFFTSRFSCHATFGEGKKTTVRLRPRLMRLAVLLFLMRTLLRVPRLAVLFLPTRTLLRVPRLMRLAVLLLPTRTLLRVRDR